MFPLPPSILSICLEAVVVLPEERIDDGEGNGEGIKTGLLLLAGTLEDGMGWDVDGIADGVIGGGGNGF